MVHILSNFSTYMSSFYKSTNYSKLNIYINSTSLGIYGPVNRRRERNRKKKWGKTDRKKERTIERKKNVEIISQNGKYTGTT
jgi:diacylglycerol kinase family enzyme